MVWLILIENYRKLLATRIESINIYHTLQIDTNCALIAAHDWILHDFAMQNCHSDLRTEQLKWKRCPLSSCKGGWCSLALCCCRAHLHQLWPTKNESWLEWKTMFCPQLILQEPICSENCWIIQKQNLQSSERASSGHKLAGCLSPFESLTSLHPASMLSFCRSPSQRQRCWSFDLWLAILFQSLPVPVLPSVGNTSIRTHHAARWSKMFNQSTNCRKSSVAVRPNYDGKTWLEQKQSYRSCKWPCPHAPVSARNFKMKLVRLKPKPHPGPSCKSSTLWPRPMESKQPQPHERGYPWMVWQVPRLKMRA